ncbi:putative uncharacterized protein DDB_G0291812 isoform X3 [Toxorhynchites rutilus septentrionalis]|uniref:putative uncharacterized protein DDB_G0291812 isoform X3 n=1 Tax=Toxorhynchites rutilus septentrionalis TaxID=329112 RepID=UPI00247862CF|nr:putative uncharacterized protein DDB_G0291812 isoform X3 [Toxorhynchites rutilus septentrionalis]
MSQPNHFQPWKQNRSIGIPSIASANNNNGYGNLPAAAHQQSIQLQQVVLSRVPTGGTMGIQPLVEQSSIASSTTSGISSSNGSASSSVSSSALNDFLSQLGANRLMLGKLGASYGLTNLSSGTGLDQDQPHQAGQQQFPIDDCASDKERELRIHQMFENAIGDCSKKQIVEILEKISILRPPERLLLYLRMPGGYPETADPLRQSQNPLGTRSEINHTINWVRSHLEHDPNVSIPKQEVYDDYTTYCERIDIKPLSTADFGKVMKQVFPGIRPRRLGTRGHSRYCYAAMRKATKLAAPKLPDLGTSSTGEKVVPEDHIPTDEEAWKVVKMWAEAMLPGSFGTINELASFITKNNLNSPASIASRQLLQKKLLQREIKERKKLTNAALKKRRRKRLKTLSSSIDSEAAPSEPAAPSSAVLPPPRDSNAQHNISTNQPVIAPTVSTNTANPGDVLQQTIKHERKDFTDEDNNNVSVGGTCEMLKKQQEQLQSTNLNCDTSNSNNMATTAAVSRELRSPAEEYNIFCKKVRQAQQLKAAAQNQVQQALSSSLKPTCLAAKRAASIAHSTRQKRLRLLQQQQQQSIEAQNNTAPRYDEMGNLILIDSQELVTSSKEDFIIPRERVISICNMDKNALDDYLNCQEENSQDQDQELLQYFPEENNGGLANTVANIGSSSGSSLNNTSYGGIFDDTDTNVKLLQLRSMLEQNMGQGGPDKPQIGGQLDGFEGSVGENQLCLQPGSASASLAMLSQRHHSSSMNCTESATSNSADSKKNHNMNLKLSHDGCYGFVPISGGPRSPRVPVAKSSNLNNTPNASPFVSPRNTPIHRKTKGASNGLTLNILQQNQQSLQGYQPRQPYIKNELPASAPPSPSIVQSYRFGVNPNPLNCSNTVPSFQPICGPSSQMLPNQNLSMSLESRSSSVPLIPNYDGYQHSNFTSVSQTPVPSECDDFSDPNNILDMLNEPSTSSNNNQHSIKLEESEPIISDILDQDDIFPKASISYTSLSRSVPSTPLPHHNVSFSQTNPNCRSNLESSSNSKSLFELPKSVPSTPIALKNGRESLFQYSPETSRDYLINGNSVDRTVKLASFYPNQSAASSGNNNASTSLASIGPTGSANGTTAPPPPSASGSEMSILSEGIESLTDALIGSDTLRYL